jgi:hypothetical protein
MIMNNDLGRGGTGKNTENLTIKRQCSCRHSNVAALEHKSEVYSLFQCGWLCVCVYEVEGVNGRRERDRAMVYRKLIKKSCSKYINF